VLRQTEKLELAITPQELLSR